MLAKTLGREIDKEVASGRASTGKAIEHFINAGEMLAQVSEEKSRQEFEDWLSKNCHVNLRQAYKYIRIAVHKEQARRIVADEGASIDDLQKLLPRRDEAPEQTEADANSLAYVGAKPGEIRNSDDWHTPKAYTDAARKVMGSIDLDPFSSRQANKEVGATRILTMANDAFVCDWAAPDTRTVWMNPPYSRGASSRAIDKFLQEFDYGAFDQGIVLMNSSTDTNWFHRMCQSCNAVCFTKGRIAFEDAGGKTTSGNTKGQVFFYFGKRAKTFVNVFSEFGWAFCTEVVAW